MALNELLYSRLVQKYGKENVQIVRAGIPYRPNWLTDPITGRLHREFDNDGEVEVANVRKTADNAMLVTIKPALVTGSITQQWQSPSRLSLAAIQNTQYAATMGIPGTLNITSPSGLWNITLPNVILKGVPSAPTMTVDGVQQVKISFSCDIPTSLNIGAIASTAMAALNLLG